MNKEMEKYNIGRRNYIVVRKLLWKNNILIKNEAVGGSVVRTMQLDMATGKTFVKTPLGVQEI